MRSHQDHYDLMSVVVHWAIAAIVLGISPLGIWMSLITMATPGYNILHLLHRSFGELAWILAMVQVVWMQKRAKVTEIPDLAWRQTAARIAKTTLIALLLIVPGVKVARGAFGLGWAFFGLTLKAPLPANPFWGHLLSTAHLVTAYLLLAVSGLHAFAALWHHFGRRDETLSRMAPRHHETLSTVRPSGRKP